MAAWSRDTIWRQGALLSQKAVEVLGLSLQSGGAVEAAAIVVSHDCDLVQLAEVEPMVELVLGRRVERPDGNLLHGKNPRRLQLPINVGNGWVELDARWKKAVKKEDLAPYRPDAALSLTLNEKMILQRWLAARYRRAAFPDEFNNRLSTTGLAERLARIMSKTGAMISAVYFDLDHGKEIVRTADDGPYELEIYIMYSTSSDPEAAAADANDAKAQVEQAFRRRCYDASYQVWQQIELVDCIVVSDEALTVAQSEKLRRWNGDYISLRQDPTQIILSE